MQMRKLTVKRAINWHVFYMVKNIDTGNDSKGKVNSIPIKEQQVLHPSQKCYLFFLFVVILIVVFFFLRTVPTNSNVFLRGF